MQKEIKSTYERLIPSKAIPYWVYFPTISFILLFIFEMVIGFDANHKSQISIIGIMAELAIMPTFFIWSSKHFQVATREISTILWDEESDF